MDLTEAHLSHKQRHFIKKEKQHGLARINQGNSGKPVSK